MKIKTIVKCLLFLGLSNFAPGVYAQLHPSEPIDPNATIGDHIYGNKQTTGLYIFGNTNTLNGPYLEMKGQGNSNGYQRGAISYSAGFNDGFVNGSMVNANLLMGHMFFTKGYVNGNLQDINRLTINSTGNIGIGISTPANRFVVANDSGNPLFIVKSTGTGNVGIGVASPTSKFVVGHDNLSPLFSVNSSGIGQVKIGLQSPLNSHPDYKLGVDGKFVAKSIYVTATGWADYVFADDYKLTPLSEVEAYVKENKHLPEVPSADEVMENGIDVAKMDAILLKKVEELMLHMIEMQKQNEQLKNRIQNLEKK